jgi:hypothetical protein
LQEASGVLAEVSELTGQNQALNKQFMALAGEIGLLPSLWRHSFKLGSVYTLVSLTVCVLSQLLVLCAPCSEQQHSSRASQTHTSLSAAQTPCCCNRTTPTHLITSPKFCRRGEGHEGALLRYSHVLQPHHTNDFDAFITHAGEVKGLKAQCNSLADAAQAEKFELLAAKQENDRLNDQIVQVRE